MAKPIIEVAAPQLRNGVWMGAAILHLRGGDVRLVAEAPEPLLRQTYALIAERAGRALQSHGCAVSGKCSGCGRCNSSALAFPGVAVGGLTDIEVAGLWGSIKKAAKSVGKAVGKVASKTVEVTRDVVESDAWKGLTVAATFIPVVGPAVAGSMAAATAAEAMLDKAEAMAKDLKKNPSNAAATAVIAATSQAVKAQTKALAIRKNANREIAAANLVRMAGAGHVPSIVQVEKIAGLANAGNPAAQQAGKLVTLAIKSGAKARAEAVARLNLSPAQQAAHDLFVRLATRAAI